MTSTAPLTSDFVIVGGGIAGLRAAVALAHAGRVLILTKADASESNTGYAQGGIAVAMGPGDSADLHMSDTLAAGAGLCDEGAVRVLVGDGPGYVQELVDWGTAFDRGRDGRLVYGLEAAHSVHRILHAGDATGREISRAMWVRVAMLPTVHVVNHALVTDLLVDDAGVSGVGFFDERGQRHVVHARRVLLATGGSGQIYRETTNPGVATGDGLAMALAAGARTAALEFVQFHPTALKLPGAPRFLISEALRGEGARLVNSRGDAFMTRYHKAGDLAPRDVVARSLVQEETATQGAVYLTLQHLDPERVRARFPTIAAWCRNVGIDIATDRIPVGPAAHYMMGGIDTDQWGRTSVPGLFAAGESACTGVHGANRLASNSLLEGLVFGARAGVAMQESASAGTLGPDRVRAAQAEIDAEGEALADEDAMRDLLWRQVGLFRTREGLDDAVRRMTAAYRASEALVGSAGDREPAAWRRRNLATVGMLVARAALRREESRGGHFRADFPARDDIHLKVHLFEQRS